MESKPVKATQDDKKTRTFQEDQHLQFNAIGHSIGKIIEKSQNNQFKDDAMKSLGVTVGNRKSVPKEVEKMLNKNYPSKPAKDPK